MKQQKRGGPQKRKPIGTVLIVVICALVLLAVALAVISFFVSRGESASANIEDYLSVFSILITMIAVVLPLTSYFINKDELKKADEQALSRAREADGKIEAINARYVELLENLVKKNDIMFENEADPYLAMSLQYINALSVFENGAYADSREYIHKALELLGKMSFSEQSHARRDALLVYKLFTLYRKLAGRTRNEEYYDELIGNLDRLIVRIGDEAAMSGIVRFLSVRCRLDRIEKTYELLSAQELSEVEREIGALQPDRSMYYPLQAKYHYIRAYYYRTETQTEEYALAVENARLADRFLSRQQSVAELDELEKTLIADGLFLSAKVLEKSSYCMERREDILQEAQEIVNRLIQGRREAKYFLELSEIQKKKGDEERSDWAALYGFSLAPTDPLLAAQCAFVYFRKYLVKKCSSEASAADGALLTRAADDIGLAYGIYEREKGMSDGKKGKINVRFSYVSSLYAIIYAYRAVESGREPDRELLQRLCGCVNDAIDDNNNNVPNYRRAIVMFLHLRRHAAEEGRALCEEALKDLVARYLSNSAFRFGRTEYYYGFSAFMQRFARHTETGGYALDESKWTKQDLADALSEEIPEEKAIQYI